MLIANTPEQINVVRLLTLQTAVKLEAIGMRRHGPSAASIARKECGLKPRAPFAEVLEALQARIDGLSV